VDLEKGKIMTARSHSATLGRERSDLVAHVAALYGRHRDDVYRLALRYGRADPQWAEDIVQDVFVALCRRADAMDELDDLRGWLYRVATNACLSRLRRERVRNAPGVRWLLGTVEPTPDPDPETHNANLQAVRRLLGRMERLPPRERIALCMLHLDDLQQAEIAEVLGLSRGYVSKLIKRAHRRLRQEAKEDHDDQP
jgi:RNA polymerase sigma-70 factor, ECF subfamily